MGWANCGCDSKGRPNGYAHDATCDHPGCDEKIHRGLAYACGGMHGEEGWSCDGYFCMLHLQHCLPIGGYIQHVCNACYVEALDEARKNPEDDAELAAFFDGEEGPDWRTAA